MKPDKLYGIRGLVMQLARSVGREHWMDRARCRHGYDNDNGAFAEERTDGTQSRRVMDFKMVCGRCPVRRECLEYGMGSKHSREFGIYGGTIPSEREDLNGDAELLLTLHAAQIAMRLPLHLAAPDVRLDAATARRRHTDEDSCPYGKLCPMCRVERKQAYQKARTAAKRRAAKDAA
jgi:WhiB family redox-sensing transcriptional regulator